MHETDYIGAARDPHREEEGAGDRWGEQEYEPYLYLKILQRTC